MSANQKLRERAAMLGRLIRGVDELNTRLETLEQIATRALPGSR